MEQHLTLREIQLEELDILKKVTKYIDDKELRYYIAGGTLLGAIRHNGFIPWDDDIDILMPREDYEKFIKYAEEDFIGNNYETLTLENGKHNRPFCKVINKNISIKSKSKEDKNLWIDIFPLDGLPDSMEESKKIIKKCLFYKGQIYLRTTKCKEILKEKKSIYNKFIKLILKPFTYRHKIVYYSCKINNIAKKYDYSNSNIVGSLVWTDGYQAIYNKKWFNRSIKHEFEDGLFNIPEGWDEYLKNLYGDYMVIPSEENRTSHTIIAKNNE